jgi:hypothetical protein
VHPVGVGHARRAPVSRASIIPRCSRVALPCARFTLSMLRISRSRCVMMADVASASAVISSALRALCGGGKRIKAGDATTIRA